MRKLLWTFWTLLATSFALRLFLIFRYRFDSDEPQHLHVAWGWAHGFMQYRDLFDNHMPAFHLLSAPLFLFGDDDARLLFVARMAMLPLFAAAVFLAWRIAGALFDERVAGWSAVLVALCPPFFLGSLEYRADDLWIVCWLGVIAVLISDLPRNDKDLAAGMLLGLAFGVSMKSVLCAGALAGAAILTSVLTADRGAIPISQAAKRVGTIVGIALIVPVAIGVAFALAGAWKPFFYGVFDHNRIRFEHAWRVLWFIPLYLLIRITALAIARSDADALIVRRRLFVFLACAGYLLLLVAFWPMTSDESYLPFYPLAVVLITPFLLRRRVAVTVACAAAIAAIVIIARPWKDEARREIDTVMEVVSMTGTNETVMDLKGESIFRVRPSYLVLEGITNAKLRMGLLRDSIADSLVRSATHVVVNEKLPPHTRRFVDRYYVPWGSVYVAGVRLPQLRGDGSATPFTIGVPGPYVVISEHGMVRAMIDGILVRKAMYLKPGRHTLVAMQGTSRPLVIWSGVLRWPFVQP